MSGDAKMTILLCSGLEAAEQAKVERLDGPIAGHFMQAGLVARLCQGLVTDGERILEFSGPNGVVGRVPGAVFMAAADQAAVATIALTGR
jgi:hypothetical protein